MGIDYVVDATRQNLDHVMRDIGMTEASMSASKCQVRPTLFAT